MKNTKAFAALLLCSASMTANAATVTSVQSAEADLAFSHAATLTHTLTPVQSVFEAKPYSGDLLLAIGQITGGDNSKYEISIPYTAIQNPAQIPGSPGSFSVTGKNDPLNKEIFRVTQPDVNTPLPQTEIVRGVNHYRVGTDGRYAVRLFVPAPRTVEADTYHVTIDAGLWHD